MLMSIGTCVSNAFAHFLAQFANWQGTHQVHNGIYSWSWTGSSSTTRAFVSHNGLCPPLFIYLYLSISVIFKIFMYLYPHLMYPNKKRREVLQYVNNGFAFSQAGKYCCRSRSLANRSQRFYRVFLVRFGYIFIYIRYRWQWSTLTAANIYAYMLTWQRTLLLRPHKQ